MSKKIVKKAVKKPAARKAEMNARERDALPKKTTPVVEQAGREEPNYLLTFTAGHPILKGVTFQGKPLPQIPPTFANWEEANAEARRLTDGGALVLLWERKEIE